MAQLERLHDAQLVHFYERVVDLFIDIARLDGDEHDAMLLADSCLGHVALLLCLELLQRLVERVILTEGTFGTVVWQWFLKQERCNVC